MLCFGTRHRPGHACLQRPRLPHPGKALVWPSAPNPERRPLSDPTPAYRVLARKYRPETFADLVGQEAMVRTLKNAFAADRIAHAFIMTGIRGTGKTTPPASSPRA